MSQENGKHKSIYTGDGSVVAQGSGWKGKVTKEWAASVWGDENVPELRVLMVAQLWESPETPEFRTLE